MNDKKFERFGIMLDCSRNAVLNVKTVKKWILCMADLGYNSLMLYTEDTYRVENQPYFGYLRGAYTAEELKEIDSFAAAHGVELVPCIQTLAHLNAIFHWSQYADVRDNGGILLVDSEKTYQLIDDMFSSLEKNFTSRTVNIGMDEANMLGRGKYKDLHGDVKSMDILLKHLNRVAEIAKKHGFSAVMWGDLFFSLQAEHNDYVGSDDITCPVNALIPDNVDIIYWDYYSHDKNHYDKKMKAHKQIKDGIWFAGGLWSWCGFAPHNGYSLLAAEAALNACMDNGVKNVYLTLWGDNGGECSYLSLLPSLFYASELAKGHRDPEKIKADFEARYGLPFDSFMEADLPGTPNGDPHCIYNPEKYMLYCDPFLGAFDSMICPEDGKRYGDCGRRLEMLAEDPEFGYIFSSLAALCHVLELKWDLGIRTRSAYSSGDREKVRKLLTDYDALEARLEKFYKAYRRLWTEENKHYGFEVQDIRLGGLMLRVRDCRQCLEEYAAGLCDTIPELEEPIISYDSQKQKGYLWCSNWGQAVTASVI